MTSLPTATSQVLSLALYGETTSALEIAEAALRDNPGAGPAQRSALWWATAHAELERGSLTGVETAAERCQDLAREADDHGWAAAGLALRALALVRQGRLEPALLDLAAAEAELLVCEGDAETGLSHTSLGTTYLELRLYELAEPHLVRAHEVAGLSTLLAEAPVVALLGLVDLHTRWADELERVRPYDGSDSEVLAHRRAAHTHAQAAVAASRSGGAALMAICRTLALVSRPREQAAASLRELRTAYTGTRLPLRHGGRSAVGCALARALWTVGRRKEAVDVAREAATESGAVGDWQASARAEWLLVEMEAQSGVAGVGSGRAYASLLSRVLWQQRLSTLQGAQAALQVERLHRDNELANRAALEDPLTGVGNRRALDNALRALQSNGELVPIEPLHGPPPAVSLLVIDLNDFKQINDTYGHVVGDEVLRAAAAAMRGVARSEDLVARLGGDEFVVLACGADRQTGRQLAARVTAAIDSLSVGSRRGIIKLSASVGVATVRSPADAALLLVKADRLMYADKSRRRSRPPSNTSAKVPPLSAVKTPAATVPGPSPGVVPAAEVRPPRQPG